jgi:protein-tyrosine phosphatase
MSLIIPNLFLGSKKDATQNYSNYEAIISVIDYEFELPIEKHFNIQICDDSTQPILIVVYQTADMIDKLLKQNLTVLVDCHAGISR